MKYSRQRELILETVRHFPIHPTADEVYTQVKREIPSISLGTVYRNLNLLTGLGLLRKLETAGNSSVRYDGRNDEHCHLVCNTCGTIADMDLRLFTPIDSIVEQKTGFTVSEHDIILKGTCASCAAKGLS